MILLPKISPRHAVQPLHTASTRPSPPIPDWLRKAISDPQALASQGLEDVALVAGAAIGALDVVVRRRDRWAGAWRHRLALAAAAASAKRIGRGEDEVALRDAVLLTRPGDDVGPAGRMFLAWRRLAIQPAGELLKEESIAGVFDALGLVSDAETANDLADELRQLVASEGAVGMLTGTFAVVERHGLPHTLGAWIADALLAQRLGWSNAVPLIGRETRGGNGSGRPLRPGIAMSGRAGDGKSEVKSLLAVQARTALRAIDLSAELGRRADRLLAVAPKLRAKASETVVDRLLSEDALVASENISGISDRGLRRLFDRLLELGAVRELSGRTTFRIYGL